MWQPCIGERPRMCAARLGDVSILGGLAHENPIAFTRLQRVRRRGCSRLICSARYGVRGTVLPPVPSMLSWRVRLRQTKSTSFHSNPASSSRRAPVISNPLQVHGGNYVLERPHALEPTRQLLALECVAFLCAHRRDRIGTSADSPCSWRSIC
jgi:hypothetical protein